MSSRFEQLLREAARDSLGIAVLAHQAARSGRYHACMDITLGVLLVAAAFLGRMPILGLGGAFILYGALHLRHWQRQVAHWREREAYWRSWVTETEGSPGA